MEGLFSYFESHYIIFIILTVLLIFGFIGYFAKKKSDKEKPYKLADENELAEKELENIAQTVSKNASIKDFMSHNAIYQNPTNQAPSQPVAPAAPTEEPKPTPQVVQQQPAPQPLPTASATQGTIENL